MLPLFHNSQLRAFLGMPPADDDPRWQQLVAALDMVIDALARAAGEVPPQHLETDTGVQGKTFRSLVLFGIDPLRAVGDSLDSGRFDWSNDLEFQSAPITQPAELARRCRALHLPTIERLAMVDEDAAEEQIMESERGPGTYTAWLDYLARRTASVLIYSYGFLKSVGVEPQAELPKLQMAPIPVEDLTYSIE